MGSQQRSAEKALSAATERYKKLEESSALEKHQLRLDKQELEAMLRRKDEKLHLRSQQIVKELNKKASAEPKLVGDQVEKLKAELKRAEQRTTGLKSELDTLKAEVIQRSSTVEQLRTELAQSALRTREQELSLAKAHSSILERETSLQQAQCRLDASLEDLEWHKKHLMHQENQLQLLESKLSRSISVDDDEVQKRKHFEESNWNQRLAAMEHALASEKQSAASLKEQQRTSIAIERERAEHAVAQFKAVAEELEVANLCLAERKKQREQEKRAFGDEKQELQTRVAVLIAEIQSLQQQQSSQPCEDQESQYRLEIERLTTDLQSAKRGLESVRTVAQKQIELFAQQTEHEKREHEALWQSKLEYEVSMYKSTANLAETAELQVRHVLESLMEERDSLVHKVQMMERSTPRSTSVLSETRVELQKAKLKIVALEDKLARGETSRAKDVDGKIAQLSARERKSTEEQKYACIWASACVC